MESTAENPEVVSMVCAGVESTLLVEEIQILVSQEFAGVACLTLVECRPEISHFQLIIYVLEANVNVEMILRVMNNQPYPLA